LHNAISQCGGSVLVDAVLVRPGYHQLIAELPNKFLIGLPGNPQSAVIGLITLVSNFIAGATNKSRTTFGTRIMATDVTASANEHRFVLSRQIKSLTKVGHIEPVEHLDSSMLRGFVDAEGYAVIEPGGATSGSIVSWIPLPA
jgi:molybdopterin molybdotransferase